jgi:WD40 repeat protein
MYAFAPDGKRLATGTTAATHDKRNSVALWAWDGGKKNPFRLVVRHAMSVDDVAFSPDLTTFATANYAGGKAEAAEIQIRDMETRRKRTSFTFVDTETRIQQLAFSPDGGMLMASGGGGTQLDWTTRTTLWDITAEPPQQVGAFPAPPVFSPDGRLLAVPTEEGVLLQAARTGKLVADLRQPREVTSSSFGSYNNYKAYPGVQFSPDGKLLVVTGLYNKDQDWWLGEKARLWQVNPVKELCVLDGGREAVFSPDGRTLLIRYNDDVVKLWEVRPLSGRTGR